jgi:hypothetical protein
MSLAVRGIVPRWDEECLFLGDGLIAPSSNDFVHVSEFATPCESEPGSCFLPSPALRESFLPSRLRMLGRVLNIPIVDDPCTGASGGSGGSGMGGFPGTGGEEDPGPAPDIDISLPSAEDSIVELQAEEAAIRDQYGEFTLSGKSAKSTH